MKKIILILALITACTAVPKSKDKKVNTFSCGWVNPTKIPSGTPENPTIIKPPQCGYTSAFGKAGRQRFAHVIDTSDMKKQMLTLSATSETQLPINTYPPLGQSFYFGYNVPNSLNPAISYPVDGLIKSEILTDQLRKEIEREMSVTIPASKKYAIRFYHRFPASRGKNINWEPKITLTSSERPESVRADVFIMNQGRDLQIHDYQEDSTTPMIAQYIFGTSRQP